MASLPKHGALPPEYSVPDLLGPNLRLVFCGTALGRISAAQRAYYANPGNFFWRTLHAIGLTPERLAPTDYSRLLEQRIGLTDLCKAHFGNDAELPDDAFDVEALRAKILEHQPHVLAFTSKTGASAILGRPTGCILLGFQPEAIGATRIYVLPSPSGQARVFWNQSVWQQLADAVREL